MDKIKNTCCSLGCRLILYCNRYNNGIDRGDKCPVFDEIKSLVQATDKDRAEAEKSARIANMRILVGRADTLQTVCFQLNIDDMEVKVKSAPNKDYHIVAKDAQNNFWKDGQIYDFLINECLGWNPDGSLQDGYGRITDAIIQMCADAEEYGVRKNGVRYES